MVTNRDRFKVRGSRFEGTDLEASRLSADLKPRTSNLEPKPTFVSLNVVAWCVTVVSMWITAPTAWADSASEGLKLYRQKRYDEAAKRWQDTLAKHPEDPVAQYDLGAATYRQGHYSAAAQAFSHALSSAGPVLRSRIAYNLGNSQYRLGQAKAASSPNEALPFYQQALDAYRTAVQQDPHDVDAKFNYELTQQRMKQLKAKAQQSQASQSQSTDQSPQQQASSAPQSDSGNDQARQAHADQAQQAKAQDKQRSAAQPGQETQQTPGQPGGTQEQQAGPSAERAQDQTTSASASETPPRDRSSKESASTGSIKEAEPSNASQTETGTSGAPATDAHAISTQQALWILDAIQQEERTPMADHGPAQERSVERDW